MARLKENPLSTIISMRISENEYKYLKELMEKTNRSISNIMREAIEHFADSHKKTKPSRKAV